MIEVALALWPWWTGPLLVVWWVSLIEATPEEPDSLAAARGCVWMLSLVVTFVWVVGLGVWLARLL